MDARIPRAAVPPWSWDPKRQVALDNQIDRLNMLTPIPGWGFLLGLVASYAAL